MLEMLGLNDEALVQYDELDALFSQFVANFSTCDNLKWLSQFQRPLDKWHGLQLKPALLEDTPSLLELRAYIFARQSRMLLLINKVWEVRAIQLLIFLFANSCVIFSFFFNKFHQQTLAYKTRKKFLKKSEKLFTKTIDVFSICNY